MDHSTIVFFVSASCLLVIATGLNSARREFARKRREYRMAQALRHGLRQAQGIEAGSPARAIEWQSSEIPSVRFS
jgi:hypothetical protein